ncbi:hypothetical protein PFISCL1PPCAC_18701, partial [Pristionchus fissidentatus]
CNNIISIQKKNRVSFVRDCTNKKFLEFLRYNPAKLHFISFITSPEVMSDFPFEDKKFDFMTERNTQFP